MAKGKKKTKQESSEPTGYKPVAANRKAHFNYALEDRFEAGLSLVGTEVKSLRLGRASIAEAFGRVRGDEVWLINAEIPVYENGGYANHDPKRPRKLLLHAREIRGIKRGLEEKGHTLVPLSLYFNHRGLVKIRIALAKGKGKADKREDVKRRDQEREIDREMARYRRGK